jgi:hypothetical protein
MWNLGLLGAAGAPLLAGGDYDLLAAEILSSSSASVTFSNLNSTYGSTYQHLQIRLVARGNRNAHNSPLYVQFNGSGGTAYASHNLLGTGLTTVSENFTSKALIERAGNIAGSQAGSTVYGANIIDILDPFNTSKNTTLRGLGGGSYPDGRIIGLWTGFWNNTAAIDSIRFTDYSGTDFQVGSRFSLYGLRSVAV